jgi:type II secretory pathway component PulC
MGNDTQKILIPVTQNPDGGVVVDNRGRNVWQWKDEQLDSTSIVLKRLENDALQLEPTRRVKKLAEKEAQRSGAERKGDPRRAGDAMRPGDARVKGAKAERNEPGLNLSTKIDYKAGGGFDPYNRS